MTLSQKIKRSANCRRYYQRKRDDILPRKRTYMAERRHLTAIGKAIAAARIELAQQGIGT